MKSILNTLFTTPFFADDDRTRNAHLAHIIIWATLALNILSVVITYLFSPSSFNITLNLITAVVQVGLLYLVHQGYTQQAGIIFAVFGWVIITEAAHTVDGLLNPIIALYVLPILFLGLMVSVRAGLALTMICVATVMAFAISSEIGDFPQIGGHVDLGTRLSHYVTLFTFTGVAIYLSMGTVQSALARARATESQLRERNLQLNEESEKREHAQQNLAANELRWRFALDGSDTGVWDMNLETGEVFRSLRYKELLGYKDENNQNVPNFGTLVHPDDIKNMEAKRDAFLKQPIGSYKNEMRLRCADGTYRWFLYRGNIIERKPNGEALRFAGTLTDITERKQMEETLRVSERDYRTVFDNNPSPMWIFDKTTLRFIAVNDAAIALYGYSREEFLNMTLRDIRPSEDVAKLEEAIHDDMPTFSAPELWQHRTRDGRLLQVEITGHETIFQGKIARLILIRDMTSQRETEESLRASRELYNRVFDSVPVGVAVSRIEDGQFLSVNPYLAAMLEFTREDMIEHTSTELKIMDIAARKRYVEEVKAKASNPNAFKSDMKLKTRTGRSIDALMSTQQVKLDGENALLSIIVDVTAIKRTERERLQIELLQTELDKQREIVELKENFISRVSHEFRSPLSIILTGTGILRMHDAKFTSEQRSERLSKIETQIHYLGNLLDNILTIGKARAGKFQFNPHAIDIVKFCHELFEDFRLTDNDKHQFVFEALGDFSHARMDDKLLQHILMNLISNAIKYSPAGKQVNLHMKRDNQDVVIDISDQGIGIPEEEQNQVFEPFFRSKNAEAIKGTGLGLAITKESVDAHQGSITWRSKHGQGTTFTVRLPGGFRPAFVPQPETQI